MSRQFNHQKYFKYFFTTTVILLLIAIAIDKYISFEKPELKKKYISAIEADSLFREALRNYGVEAEFIKVIRNAKNPADSFYSVKVYNDVPIPLLLLEFENLFNPTNAVIESYEEKIGGKTITKILVDDKLILKSEFITNPDLYRAKGRIGFVIYNPDYNSDNIELLNTPELIIFLITPSEQAKNFVKKISSSGKRFAILLDDSIEDLNFKLDESYSVKRNKKSFENLFKYFPSAAFIVYDDKSELFTSSAKDFLLKELDWRKAFYVKLSQFDLLESHSTDPVSAFGEMIKMMKKNEPKIILVDAKNFSQLLPVIPDYRKIGYKFVSATELLR